MGDFTNDGDHEENPRSPSRCHVRRRPGLVAQGERLGRPMMMVRDDESNKDRELFADVRLEGLQTCPR